MGLQTRGRGRPARVRASEIAGRADNFRWILNEVWDRLWPLLSGTTTQEDVITAFQAGASPYDREFAPALAGLALQVLRDPKFPKRREPQIAFLADSLAGLGRVSPRRSRDICEQHRAEQKRAHHIIRYEFWIECSCGHKGRSRDHACPKCGAEIVFGFDFASGPLPFS
jgi:hypothetical protein